MQTPPDCNLCDGMCTHINLTSHSTIDGVPEINVQDYAQAVAMATKHAKSYIACRRNPCLDAHFS